MAGQDVVIPISHSTHKFRFLKLYDSWFKLFHSSHPQNPCSTAGVAFLLNKELIDTEHVMTYDLIPGRAIMISVPWHKGEVLAVLNIYAYNKPKDRSEMWTELWEKRKTNADLPFPSVPVSFQRLKSLLKLEDRWRKTFPDSLDSTCVQYRTDL
ncbi:hypothetical protein DFH08DRAFT_706046 [Mycena albidolilacea]|uniref:Uncharacterized protein n=1 Tax=Mycena albidolilacea TaxID=1033008 RepID=A0AAD6ZTC6_9AGAR|nr:hypothetical protein DFH08DRAFT_706046 [Mycena albidolilacea]